MRTPSGLIGERFLVQSPSSGAEELVEVVVTCVDDEGLWMRLDATARALNRAAETEVWPQRSAFFVAYKDLGLISRNS